MRVSEIPLGNWLSVSLTEWSINIWSEIFFLSSFLKIAMLASTIDWPALGSKVTSLNLYFSDKLNVIKKGRLFFCLVIYGTIIQIEKSLPIPLSHLLINILNKVVSLNFGTRVPQSETFLVFQSSTNKWKQSLLLANVTFLLACVAIR